VWLVKKEKRHQSFLPENVNWGGRYDSTPFGLNFLLELRNRFSMKRVKAY
jgi:hypothetical protein